MDAQAKQQIVERVKQANNVLVTVSNNPSVDQLAACIGLTLLLNKMQKHGTAVFSGKVPSTLEFLQPEKTIEANTDSLRDFIISLDKNKADKLRYKVEDNVVRIFITPYRTSLSEKDLVFSQGELNVDVVVALGVHDRTQVDAAITSHGRILHDATIISLAAGPGKAPDLGQVNWQDQTASSLCEMLVSISEAFGQGLLDSQISTAFLTGIVSETARFSNPKTSPKTMTMAAQLMAAGANQQLIVSKLEPPKPQAPPAPPPAPRQPTPPAPKPPAPKKPGEGTLNVSHDKGKKDDNEVEIIPGEIHIDEKGNLKTSEEIKDDIEKQRKDRGETTLAPEIARNEPEPEPAPAPAAPEPAPEPPPPQIIPDPVSLPPAPQPAAADGEPKPHELLDPINHRPTFASPFTADTQEWVDPYNSVSIDPMTGAPAPGAGPQGIVEHEKVVAPPPEAPKTPLGGVLDTARNAVENALTGGPPPVAAATAPQTLPLPGSPSVPDAMQPPAAPSVPPPLPQVPGMATTVVSPTQSPAQTPAAPLF